MRHVIIGGGPAGLKAAERIRERDPKAEIIIFSSEKERPYARYLLPELLGGERDERSLYFQPPDFFSQKEVDLRMGETVEEIDTRRAVITTASGKCEYDTLLIATGGQPALPRSSLLNIKGVFVLRTLSDARAIDSFLRKERIKEAAVVGGGIVGLKVAYMLSRRGIDVTIVEQESRLLPRVLDSDSLRPISKLCWKNGFKILLDERFREFTTSEKGGKISHLVTYAGRSIRCGAAILCPGVTPSVALAKAAGIPLRKGIIVDKHMRAGADNVFAAGDAAETLNAATGEHEHMPLWQNALDQGRVAAENMTGKESEYAGGVWQNSLEVFGASVVTLGQSHMAEEIPEAKVLLSPGFKKGHGVRLVFASDRLIGATLLGDTRNVRHYKRIIAERIPAWDFRGELLDENFNPLRLHLQFGTAEEEGLKNPRPDSSQTTPTQL
jgi:NAD(P)H-nitrite reductase large subunit